MSDGLLYRNLYNPDVLSCLANLSNDEVFTPPQVVNAMLDMLPQELFRSPDTTFLDPVTKSGVFLREIAKRLLTGLADVIPDVQARVDHIFHHQLYGIAITELTSLLARRSVYCSKFPNSMYSVTRFDNAEGNIRFKHIRHRWKDGRCVYCGASEAVYSGEQREGRETHAYEFIHTDNPEEIFGMKFDVIVGNPPYQLSTGGSGVQATPIYNVFVQKAKKLNPRFLTMIIPARWFSGGFGLDAFRNEMLHDQSIKEIHDYPEAKDCFSGVQIKGGVCYFLWDRDYKGDCSITTHRGTDVSVSEKRPLLEPGCDTFIRYNEAVNILHKVRKIDGCLPTVDTILSSQKPFGLGTKFKGEFADYASGRVLVYGSTGQGYANREDIPKLQDMIDRYKVYIPAAGSGSDSFPHQILGRPFFGNTGTACSETYIVAGPFENKIYCQNFISYVKTRLFRFLVMLKKPTQHALKMVYSFVPLIDCSMSWSDELLYARYGLTKEEIAFIESMIKPME